jgi:1-acyl-sn-glycerol-3-phosphate acyltransferase
MAGADTARRPVLEPWYRIAVGTLRPPMALWFNWHLEGREHVPAEGPVLVACNHLSLLDPLCQGYFLVKSGRRPRFLAKSELYRNRFLRTVLKGAGQIPVERGSGASTPVDAALDALAAGECVVVYPEGTLTRNPDHSPMQAKMGIARLALATGVPVVPVAVWGSQYVLPRGMDDMKRSLSFGRPIMVRAGTPLDLAGRAGRADGAEEDRVELRRVTDAVMDELSRLVEDLRSRYPKRWVR